MAQAMLDQANFSMIQSQSRLVQEQKDIVTLLSTFTENIEDQQNQNSSEDNNVVQKKKWKKELIIAVQKLKNKKIVN